jgi:hypothetical protein
LNSATKTANACIRAGKAIFAERIQERLTHVVFPDPIPFVGLKTAKERLTRYRSEIEKGFSGSKSSGSTDGGTSSRVFGSFLSWMQEKDQPVFVVATANDVSKLPPEFLRKGRFDEMFFVDLPDAQERAQIWDIVIKRHGRRPAGFDTVALSRACEQFTGAEIEAVFIDALHEAYAEGREPGSKDILDAIANTVPLAQLMDGQISALRHWAKGRARDAGAPVKSTPATPRGSRRVQSVN